MQKGICAFTLTLVTMTAAFAQIVNSAPEYGTLSDIKDMTLD